MKESSLKGCFCSKEIFTKQDQNVVICPPCGESVAGATKEGQNRKKALWPLLPRLTAVLPPQGREMPNAFTLIELLVVVLIIGILATIAVPQYRSAVAKAQYAKMRAFANSLVIASQAAYLRKGEVPHTFDELDITVPGDMTIVSTTIDEKGVSYYYALGSEFYCCLMFPVLNYSSGGVVCGRNDLNIGYVVSYLDDDGVPTSRKKCLQKTAEETLCQKLPGATKTSGEAMLIPTGLAHGYTHFEIMD